MSECLRKACWSCLLLISFTAVAAAQDAQTQNPPSSAAQPSATQRPDPQQPPVQQAPSQPTQSQQIQVQPPQTQQTQQGQPAQTQQAPQDQQSQEPSDTEGGGFVFKKEVEEVVLHAIVVDQNNHLVSNLDRESFSVFEDGKPQKITSFRHEDVPVALGILVDNSGSMLPKRTKLTEAAVKLVEASQGQDRVFVVNFGENPYLDQDFTSDVAKLKIALERTDTQGSTALYDALVASAEHLDEGAPQGKKILLVVTDGEDNASRETLSSAMRKLQTKAGPVVYAIVLRQDGYSRTEGHRAIQSLCENTGGAAFFPNSLDEVRSIAEGIARDIRSQYVIGYRAPNSAPAGTYHSISVKALDYGKPLRVSTRTGYYTGSLNSPQ